MKNTETATSNMTTTSVSIAANPGPINAPHQQLIKVKIKYPKDYSKKKFFEDGAEPEVSRETADGFISAGIAKEIGVVEESETVDAEAGTTTTDSVIGDVSPAIAAKKKK